MGNAGMQPIADADRAIALDAVRGVALFGVFLVNLVDFAGAGLMATQAQLAALPTGAADYVADQVMHWLVTEKANTLFAFLFGVGFSLQLQRAAARGVEFQTLYLRRLLVLLLFGCLHLFFVWTWDILHLYALAGLALLLLHRLSDRALLLLGIPLALFGRDLGYVLHLPSADEYFEDAAVLLRQQLAAAGDYLGLLRHFTSMTTDDYLRTAEFPGWLLYVLGRFMLGAWVGRQGWLTRAHDFLPGWRRVAHVALPLGLILVGAAQALGQRYEQFELLTDVVYLCATPVLAAGYMAAVVLAVQSPRGARWLAPLRAGGQMALTNYVGQSCVYALLLFGVGPGLALGGRLGTLACIGIVIVVYALQLAISSAWLRRFRYGPLEWLWRAATYGQWPAVLKKPAAPSAPR